MIPLIDKFLWKGSEHVYSVPWLRNRIEYSSDPQRVRAYLKGKKFTRSQLSMDMLTRFHLSNNSIVVSHDEHAHFLRALFLERMPAPECYPDMAKKLVDQVFKAKEPVDTTECMPLSGEMIREVYISLLSNLLGVNVLTPLHDYINTIEFKPGTRPMHLDGIMYAFGLQLPGFGPMRTLVNWVFFKGDHYTRKIAQTLEQMVFDFSTAKPNSWYATLLDLKTSKRITSEQFRGEITSTLVSAFALSSALTSMLLCLAARPEYIRSIQLNEGFAKHFVNEVLRLYPPFRQFGYEEKGIWSEKSKTSNQEATDFMVTVYGLHRNEDIWEDADQFKPERFLNPGSAGGCKFLPFGMSKRSCVGRLYSMRLLVEVLKYVCSEKTALTLSLPKDFEADYMGLPEGASGRLVSFPIDDRICFSWPHAEARSTPSMDEPTVNTMSNTMSNTQEVQRCPYSSDQNRLAKHKDNVQQLRANRESAVNHKRTTNIKRPT
ncbi:cytochrome P450 [Litoribrevibacter euphylliae]|uniref:Cytochrome P450 n=1 Tax=Litoribrevibacter euphylliae TaxID=1834034 RepID=A0ABV7HHB9_9GAMM